MKIERLEIGGFGKLRDREILFDPDRANLLVERNEFGKSTVAEAICAALYGFRSRAQDRSTEEKLSGIEIWRPLDGGSYQVTLDIRVQGRRKRICRDFDKNTTRIFDLDLGGEEITPKFIWKKGEPRVGEFLLGLSREQFQQTCFVGQRSLEVQSAAVELIESLERMASNGGRASVSQAIDALQRALNRFPGAMTGKQVSVETELRELQKQFSSLEGNLQNLIEERRRLDPIVSELRVLESELESKRRERVSLERLRLAAEIRELEGSIAGQEQVSLRVTQLKEERDRLVPYAEFPSEIRVNLPDWLGQLRIKTADLQTVESEIRANQGQLSECKRRLDTQFAGLSTFTPADEEALIGATANFSDAVLAYEQAQQARLAELNALHERGVYPSRFEEVDQRLSRLGPAERDAAFKFREVQARDRAEIARHERRMDEQSRLMNEIDSARISKKKLGLSWAIAGAITSGVFGLLYLMTPTYRGLWIGLFVTGTVGAVCGFIARVRGGVYRADDRSRAVLERGRIDDEMTQVQASLRATEREVESLALTLGLSSADALASECLEHYQLQEVLREFHGLEQARNSVEQRKRDCQMNLYPYLQRAGRATETSDAVTLETVAELRTELKECFELCERIRKIEEKLGELEVRGRHAEEVVHGLRARLRAAFAEAGVADYDGDSFSEAYKIFVERLEYHERYRRIVEDELPEWERRRAPAEQQSGWLRGIEELRDRLSSDGGPPEAAATKSHGEYARQLQQVIAEIDEMRGALEGKRLRVGRVLTDFENRNSPLLREREKLWGQLRRVGSYQEAIKLAMDKLKSLAVDVHREWSESLNRIYEEMLSRLGTEYRSVRFADDLSFTVEAHGLPAPLQLREIRHRLSLGAREQLVLLQRLAVSRFLSGGPLKLPLIIDDPLVSSDDERFLRLMRFLIEELSPEHQILIFTCHALRHDWLRAQLGPSFESHVHQLELRPIASVDSSGNCPATDG